MDKIWKFVKDEDGIETAEYAVMGALIVAALVTAVVTLRNHIINTLSRIGSAITSS